MGDYSVNIVITYNDEEYKVLSDLDIQGYELYLAVKVVDLEKGTYPIQTYVIPQD